MKDKKWILYRHTSPSGKVYVGITSRNKAYKRWEYGHGYKGCKAFYNAILKYGWDNIKHEVLFTNLEEDRAKRLEIELIRHYKALGASYNITNGGDGYLGYTPSNETRVKMRATKIGKPLSESHRRKLSEAQMGRVGTMLGKKHSEETKLKMSMAHKGKKHSETWNYNHNQSLKSKHFHWYTNGKTNLHIADGNPIPEGFYRDRYVDDEFKKKCGIKNKGKTPWNKK